ncbi:MAG: hypothetical protein KC419_26065 [Anaerolineales bacterium]|nr:hypothetical protein [Anaerolineales bacterium]MCA9931988.1 hypothetical protein [Anaerolineales bacterium]
MNLLQYNKKLGLVFLMSLFLFVFVPSAMAFEGRGDDNVTIEAGEVIEDDLYVGTNKFVLNGTIKGDLIIGAQDILINGTVDGDLWAGGQMVEINGTITGDAHIGATAVTLSEGAEIGEDLVAFGYSLHNKAGSLVGKELVFGGYQALLEGDITEDAWAGANSLQINGRIGGNVTAEVGGDETAPPVNPYQYMPEAPAMPVVATGLTIDDAAEIGGDLTYRAPQSSDVPTSAVGGTVDFTREIVSTGVETQPTAGETVWRHVRRFITLTLIGALLLWLAPTFIPQLSDKLQEKPVPSLGWGAIVYFGVPVIVVALFIGGILLTLLLSGLQFGNLGTVLIFVVLAVIFAFMVAFVLVLLYLTKIIIGYFVGQFILSRVSPNLVKTPYWSLLLGLLLVVAVIAVPFLGGLLNWIIAIMGVGALWLLWRSGQEPTAKMA